MQFQHHTQIGTSHIDHNEDNYYFGEINKENYVIAVFDGCSSAFESHFASTLLKKITNKAIKEIGFKMFVEKKVNNLDSILKLIIQNLFDDLKKISQQIMLSKYELMSTITMAVVNSKLKEVRSITIGDGLIFINDEVIVFDNNNKPDYLAYHLEEDFEIYFNGLNQKLEFNNVEHLYLTTDGIMSFQKFDQKDYESETDEDIIKLLMGPNGSIHNSNPYKNRQMDIEETYGLKPSDDLTIVRVVM